MPLVSRTTRHSFAMTIELAGIGRSEISYDRFERRHRDKASS